MYVMCVHRGVLCTHRFLCVRMYGTCMYIRYVSHVTKEINLDSSVDPEDFSIPREHIISALNGCCSQGNLVSRLTTRVFTTEERLSSNSRGLCGKRSLNSIKLDAVHGVCLKHFPLDRMEQESHAQRT